MAGLIRVFMTHTMIQVSSHGVESQELIGWLCRYSHDGWYNWIHSFYCGRASQCVDGEWGYLDRNGDVAIPMIYDEAGNFKDGRADVQIEGERFYIDIKGLKL